MIYRIAFLRQVSLASRCMLMRTTKSSLYPIKMGTVRYTGIFKAFTPTWLRVQTDLDKSNRLKVPTGFFTEANVFLGRRMGKAFCIAAALEIST